MAIGKQDPGRVFYDEFIIKGEGGYSHLKEDPETLFGVTHAVFVTAVPEYLKALGPRGVSRLPADVRRGFQAIANADSENRGEVASRVMQYIGRMLNPYGKATQQPASGKPLRSTEHPEKGATAGEIAAINAVKDFTFHLYETEYRDGNKFNKLPSKISDLATDIAINSGAGRANWAMVKALREVGLLSDAEFNGPDYPYMTTKEATMRTSFADGAIGELYSKPEMALKIARKLNGTKDVKGASPLQLQFVEYHINNWRLQFYEQLAEGNSEFSKYMKGWRNRVEKISDMPYLRKLLAQEGKAAMMLDAQYVAEDSGYGSRGNLLQKLGFEGHPGKIGIEVTGWGLVEYFVHPKTLDPIRVKNLPEGVTWLEPNQSKKIDGVTVHNPYPNYHTITFNNPSGKRMFIELTPPLHREIALRSTYENKLGIEHVLPDFLTDPTGLDRERSAHVKVFPDVTKKYEVSDRDSPASIVPHSTPRVPPKAAGKASPHPSAIATR